MLNDLTALYGEHPGIFAGTAFILGLVIGSFLNVVIYRLPIILNREWQAQAKDMLADQLVSAAVPGDELSSHFSLSVPRSACTACSAPITALQNIPLISWLALRGRCAACKSRISARYPLVELCTGLLSAWVAWHFGFGVTALCAMLLTWALIALAGIDIDHQLLPDNITLPLMWTGLLASVAVGRYQTHVLPVPPQAAIIGAASGYLSLWLVFQVFRLATGKEGMGHGDFKLFAALGAWLGWKLLPLVIILSAATGAIMGILMILARGKDKAAPMPFGPYLAAAGWFAMMYGDSLVSEYLSLSGLQR